VNYIENQKGTRMFKDHFKKWKQLTKISFEPTPTMSGLGMGKGRGAGCRESQTARIRSFISQVLPA